MHDLGAINKTLFRRLSNFIKPAFNIENIKSEKLLLKLKNSERLAIPLRKINQMKLKTKSIRLIQTNTMCFINCWLGMAECMHNETD